MDLEGAILHQLDDPTLNHTERAELRCRFAKQMEEAGDYQGARAAMGDLWQRIGERPHLDKLDRQTAAEVLLRAGTLTGWIGSTEQIEGAQAIAKDLIGESLAIFEAANEREKMAEALTELSICYWREGSYDEARLTLREALSRLGPEDRHQKAVALLRSAIVEFYAARYSDALHILTDAAPLFLSSSSHALQGKFHVNLAIVLNNLSDGGRREGYRDRALIEYAAASFHFEQAGHIQYQARTENNLGFLLFRSGRYAEAHEHLDRAHQLYQSFKDSSGTAHVNDTRALTLLAQGHYAEAESIARASVQMLEKSDERSVLAKALRTHGTALARLGRFDESRLMLQRAMDVAHDTGAVDDAGLAALTMIEELGESLTVSEMRAIYERADLLLANSQHPGTLLRLRQAVRRLLKAERTHDRNSKDKEFSAPPNFVYKSAQMVELLREAHRIAMSPGPVLITGEVGTGKLVLARMIHEWSERRGEFLAINCGELTEPLAEAQLFGEFKGTLTGALDDYPGAVRRATGGTLFLDDVTALSTANQGKLLRLIEYGKIQSVGALQPERVDVRIIAATNRPLMKEVAKGRFREDLFYRLQTFHLKIPPLRERTEDIAAVAEHFIKEMLERYDKMVKFTPDALEAIGRLPLRGNTRELRALIERAIVMAPRAGEMTPEAVEALALGRTHEASFAGVWKGCSLEQEVLQYEGGLIKDALDEAKGSVTRAARLLGVTHQGLAFILQGRHKDLLSARTPVRHRRRKLSGTSKRSKRKRR